MEFCDLSVVFVEESDDIPREVGLVLFGQLSDDGAIDSDVAGVGRIGNVDENVSRMHVGMKKVVVEYL